MDTILKPLGEMMKKARKDRDLSQTALAKLLDRDQPAISEWETGERRIAVVDFIVWANTLDLTRSEWAAFRELGYGDEPDSEPTPSRKAVNAA